MYAACKPNAKPNQSNFRERGGGTCERPFFMGFVVSVVRLLPGSREDNTPKGYIYHKSGLEVHACGSPHVNKLHMSPCQYDMSVCNLNASRLPSGRFKQSRRPLQVIVSLNLNCSCVPIPCLFQALPHNLKIRANFYNTILPLQTIYPVSISHCCAAAAAAATAAVTSEH